VALHRLQRGGRRPGCRRPRSRTGRQWRWRHRTQLPPGVERGSPRDQQGSCGETLMREITNRTTRSSATRSGDGTSTGRPWQRKRRGSKVMGQRDLPAPRTSGRRRYRRFHRIRQRHLRKAMESTIGLWSRTLRR
jgi:hypothetical protein